MALMIDEGTASRQRPYWDTGDVERFVINREFQRHEYGLLPTKQRLFLVRNGWFWA
jgi:hypothetical protein